MTTRCPHCGHEIADKDFAKVGGLTAVQAETLGFIRAFIEDNGFSPTVREIKEAIGSNSTSRVFEIVHGLEERGAIRRLPYRARSIQLVEAA